MLAKVASATLVGAEGRFVVVEVHVSSGLPSFHVVGLPDASCREARDRARAAVVSSGFKWPQTRVTVNLAPTGVRKAGPGLDVPIALGVLAASGQLRATALAGFAFIGELGLDGSLRRVPGVLPLVAALSEVALSEVALSGGALSQGAIGGSVASAAGIGPAPAAGGGAEVEGVAGWGTRRESAVAVVVPPDCAGEAALFGRARVLVASTLRELVAVLEAKAAWPPLPECVYGADEAPPPDLADVKGQALGRQALEVAAAGGHHLLLVGPAGAGKTMLASRLPGLLPELSTEDALEVAKIHSAAGLELSSSVLCRRPPFRSPHHSASAVSLVGGGGARLRPGEISCAHNGVLFLDELAEFPGSVLDNLRQPLEEGRIVVCRASATVAFPARFLLVAAMNACRCGSDGSPGSCRCPPAQRARYVGRISGPLLDRFDLRVRVGRPQVEELLVASELSSREVPAGSEPTSVVAARVEMARRRARERGLRCNSELPASRLGVVAPLSAGARRLFERRLREGRLSARGLDRARRVALTVADLAGDDVPLSEEHVLVSLALRAPGILGYGETPGPFGESARGQATRRNLRVVS